MAADQGDLTYQDPNRRDFIHIAAGVAAVGAGAMASWPLINSMNPAADTLALSTIEFDLSKVQEGQQVVIKWQGKPVFVAGDGTAELDAFARGLAAFADDPALLYARGLAWERRDDIPRAEADFRRILVSEPENVATLNALGYTLADRTTRYREALELIDRARVAEPDNPAIIDSYGWVLYRLGRSQEALVQLRRAYSMQKDPEIASHLAEVLWAGGERDEARRLFREALELDPDNRSLQRALRETGALDGSGT